MARDGQATRQRILQAAYKSFYRVGFYRSSVDAIALAAKVTKKTLYYHFPSKDALVAAVLEDRTGDAVALIQKSLPNRQPMRQRPSTRCSTQ